MKYEKIETKLKDLFIIKINRFQDNRGYFSPLYQESIFEDMGLPKFVQDNESSSSKNVLRGFHFQYDKPMGKMMRVANGKAFLFAIDIRKNSPTFKSTFSIYCDSNEPKWIYAPAGFARGFYTVTDNTVIQYKCTSEYNPESDTGINYKTLGFIEYTQNGEIKNKNIFTELDISKAIMSEKDKNLQTLDEWLFKEESNIFNI